MRWTCGSRQASVTGADGQAVWSRSPDAGIKLVDFFRGRRWLQSPVHRGERGISRNTVAQGMPVDPAEPVVTAACFFVCRRAMGEVVTLHSLHPLFSRG